MLGWAGVFNLTSFKHAMRIECLEFVHGSFFFFFIDSYFTMTHGEISYKYLYACNIWHAFDNHAGIYEYAEGKTDK